MLKNSEKYVVVIRSIFFFFDRVLRLLLLIDKKYFVNFFWIDRNSLKRTQRKYQNKKNNRLFAKSTKYAKKYARSDFGFDVITSSNGFVLRTAHIVLQRILRYYAMVATSPEPWLRLFEAGSNNTAELFDIVTMRRKTRVLTSLTHPYRKFRTTDERNA